MIAMMIVVPSVVLIMPIFTPEMMVITPRMAQTTASSC